MYNFADSITVGFYIDTRPPDIVFLCEDTVNTDTTVVLNLTVKDAISGVDWGNVSVMLDSTALAFTAHNDTISILFDGNGFSDGIHQLCVTANDNPYPCPPNDMVACINLYLLNYGHITECDRYPNPFTPNEQSNRTVVFEYPDMGYKAATITIYNIQNILIRQINVPASHSVLKNKPVWDGTDNFGHPMRQGVYLYTIECDSEIVCNGTVVIAR